MIFLTPALQVISRQWPDARFHFLLSTTGSRDIIELNPHTESILEADVTSPGEIIRILSYVTNIKPDLVFSGTRTNPLKCGLIGIACKARYRLGESSGAGRVLYNYKVPFDNTLHAVMANLRIARAILPGDHIPTPKIWTSEQDVHSAESFLQENSLSGKIVGFHHGSGYNMAYKRWPLDRFIELGRMIIEKGDNNIIIFGGPDEQAEGEKIRNALGSHVINGAGQLSVRQSYEVMKRCDVFISNDSGPMHLAATANTKVIALFGPTLDQITGPWGEGHIILTDDISCRPCYNFRPVTCTHLNCMKNITVEKVFEKLSEVIKET